MMGRSNGWHFRIVENLVYVVSNGKFMTGFVWE